MTDDTCNATLHGIGCTRTGRHPEEDEPLMHLHHRTPDEDWFVEWSDDTPGATPHTPPLVTDKEWSAALAVYFVGPDAWRHHERQMRAALEAAALIRQDTP